MQNALTHKTIQTLQPAAKAHRHFDGQGLCVEVAPSGSKYFRLKHRFRGQGKTLALGVYPDTSLKDARERRDEARRLLARGVDPMGHRAATNAAAQLQANTFEIVAREWHQTMKGDWVESHSSKRIGRLEAHVFPSLGALLIDDISPTDVVECMRGIEQKGRFETAHRALNACARVFADAVTTGLVMINPARELHRVLKPAQVRFHPTIIDPKKIVYLLRAIDSDRCRTRHLIRSSLRQVVDVTEWVDGAGTVFTPDTDLNLLSMRGSWYVIRGSDPGVFDTWLQAVVFPANGQQTVQLNGISRSMPSMPYDAPQGGQNDRPVVKAAGGASLKFDLLAGDGSNANRYPSGVLTDGMEKRFTWPAGSVYPVVTTASGPNGGGTVTATLVREDRRPSSASGQDQRHGLPGCRPFPRTAKPSPRTMASPLPTTALAMILTTLLANFFAGVFLCNCVPHLVRGLQGLPFPTPFAKPPGVGLSSSLVNFLWGFGNLVIGLLLLQFRPVGWQPGPSFVCFMAGALLIGLYLTLHFGKVMARHDD